MPISFTELLAYIHPWHPHVAARWGRAWQRAYGKPLPRSLRSFPRQRRHIVLFSKECEACQTWLPRLAHLPHFDMTEREHDIVHVLAHVPAYPRLLIIDDTLTVLTVPDYLNGLAPPL